MTRSTQLMDFLHQHLDQPFNVESLAGDASFRRYHRITLADGTTRLLMDAPPEKESVIEFVHVDEIMKQAINVPKIFAQDIEQGFLLLQDFGTVEFAHLIVDDKNNKDNYYKQALLSLIDLQKININNIQLPFYNEQKLHQEMDLFTEWFLPYIQISLNEEELQLWQTLKTVLINNIENQPKVIVHRDYHSRNLMQDNSLPQNKQNSLGVIDFQDAVIGAYTYDLVSLIRDAYIDEKEDWVNQKIQEFYQLKNLSIGLENFTKQVNIMGIQRHLKVLGIFIRLYQRDGKDRYLTNIPKVMNDLLQELIWLKENSDNLIYQQFLTVLEQKIIPAYKPYFLK